MSTRPEAVRRHRRVGGLTAALRQSHNRIKRIPGHWFQTHAGLARTVKLPCACSGKPLAIEDRTVP